jgi:hypothetical protein
VASKLAHLLPNVFLFQKCIDADYKNLTNKAKKLPVMEPLTMSSIPGYNESHASKPLTVKSLELEKPGKKKNQIERARDDLIEWIANCIFCSLIIVCVDKKQFKEHPKTVLDFYIVGRVLGRGAFGKVNLCVHKLSGKLVAIKSLHKQFLASEQNNSKFKNEISLLRFVRHKNVIRLYDTFVTENYLYVRKRRKLTEPVAKHVFKQVLICKIYYFIQILDGISCCHSKGIVHRDIKLDNILLNEYGHIKVRSNLFIKLNQ